MSRTVEYSRLHAAFATAAAECSVEPMVARVALAVKDRGGRATSQEIEADLMCDGSMVRRALLAMYGAGLAIGTAPDGGRRRPGLVTHVRLTAEGRLLTAMVVTARAAFEEVAA